MSEHSQKQDAVIKFDFDEEAPEIDEDLPDEYGEDDQDDGLNGLNLNDDYAAGAPAAGGGFSITFDLDDDFLKPTQQEEPQESLAQDEEDDNDLVPPSGSDEEEMDMVVEEEIIDEAPIDEDTQNLNKPGDEDIQIEAEIQLNQNLMESIVDFDQQPIQQPLPENFEMSEAQDQNQIITLDMIPTEEGQIPETVEPVEPPADSAIPENQMISLDINDLFKSNDPVQPTDNNLDFNFLMQGMNQDYSNFEEPKKEPKVSKNRAHFNLTDFYELRKIKYTLEFQSPLKNKMLERGQYIYTLDLKPSAEKLINECKEAGHKRVYIDIGIHMKQFKIQEIWILGKENQKYTKKRQITIPIETVTIGTMQSVEALKRSESWYLSPQNQAKYFKNFFMPNNMSKDLNSLDYLQRDLCYYKESEQAKKMRDESDISHTEILGQKPELHTKMATLKLKNNETKDIIETQLDKELKILISVGKLKDGNGHSELLTNFGIRAIDYKPEELLTTLGSHATSSYLITSDIHEASQLWIPQIFGTTRQPVNWTMNYVVPKGMQVISSGNFISKKELKDRDQELHIFKSKSPKMPSDQTYELEFNSNQGKIIPDKIGFIIGDLPHLSPITRYHTQIGAALFTSSQKSVLFESKDFYQSQVLSIIEELESMLKTKHPSSDLINKNQGLLKMVFLPNLMASGKVKQSIDFSDCIHVFDEETLLPRNVIEKRHKIYKTFATSIAFDFFGNMVWENSEEDAWLLAGLRERIGDRNKRKNCGQAMYRYHIMKTMRKFIQTVQANSERFSLSSKYVPHFSELTYGEDLYLWKCQLVMHIIETILGETHFFNVIRELLKKSKPTMSMQLFKRVLKEFGIKFYDIQKNWIDSTSCPQIECSYSFNRKNNSVNINLEQHSIVKHFLMLQKHLRLNKHQVSELCPNGQVLLQNLEEAQKANEECEESYDVELQREARRWFQGDIKVVIYQTDGAEIQAQTQKIKLKHPKTKVQCNVPLQCKVRKAIHNKKRDDNILMDEMNNDQPRTDNQIDSSSKGILVEKKEQADPSVKGVSSTMARAEQLLQQQNDNNQQRFGMMDYEYEEYPERATKSLFEVKNIDCPILWIRIDPEFEYIRKVKVHQRKDNWLFQLLQDRDHISQIEACHELRNYNDEFVYEILKSVAKNEKFFIKVRKQALRSLEVIQVSAFSQFLSHEKFFLINYYNQRNFNEKIGFYKSNDFKNILEYYLNTYLLRSLAKSKERKLMIKDDLLQIKKQQLKDVHDQLKYSGIEIANFNGIKTLDLDFSSFKNVNEADDDDNQDAQNPTPETETKIDLRDYSITSNLISNLMLRLLRENDNSDNAFDDSFFQGKILSNLGKLDNFTCMPEIAKEVQKQFNLDHTGKFSNQFAVSKGAIKSYYNMRKQIFRYQQFKKPYLDYQKSDGQIESFDKLIEQSEVILDQVKTMFEKIIDDPAWPIELRVFIYEKKVKNEFLFTEDVLVHAEIPSKFLKPLYHLIKGIQGNLQKLNYEFAGIQLEVIAKFLEKNFIKKLNYKECLLINDQRAKVIANMLWIIMAEQPVVYLDRKICLWTKRIYNTIFMGSQVPLPLEFDQAQREIMEPYKLELDQAWYEFEATQQLLVDQTEAQKQKMPGFQEASEIPIIDSFQQNLLMKSFFGTNPVPVPPMPEFMGSVPTNDNMLKIDLGQSQPPSQPTQINIEQILQKADKKGLIVENQFPSIIQEEMPQNNVITFDFKQFEGQPTGDNNIIQFDQNDFGGDKPDKKKKKKKKSKERSPSQDGYKPIGYDAQWSDNPDDISDNEAVVYVNEIDDFPDTTFNVIWQQKCWDILYKQYYDKEAWIFTQDISEESLGYECYNQYISTIDKPMTFNIVKNKMKLKMYYQPMEFINEMNLVYDNAMKFNKRGTGVYKSAQKMKKKFSELIKKFNLMKHQQEIDEM